MQHSRDAERDKIDHLVRIGPDVVFHRDVFFPVAPPANSQRATEQIRRASLSIQPGLPLHFDGE
ncbi:hypothetical protein LMG22037_05630 [Paraburkholderia phenoliruptrix]|jgi:hypothetical protein|uniref:Uncharacterized protein n=1 Tax=Paraburkholderia phenoliruptrix TaxID=252970 RepID=A0A6J5CBH6_9BURK|nr:hypothetical protein [Paraburkholderia phenoliruptrix]CAB3731663.1 hypothetical protein LMG22037_05630 [Paraburkholderia phenoliruptrix]